MAKLDGLSIMEFWRNVGKAEAERVAVDAGTSYEHFKHMAHGRRNPSKAMAAALVKSSGGKMSLMRLLFPAAV